MLRSGDIAGTVFLFILLKKISPLPPPWININYHNYMADRRKATIAHYSGRLLMNLLIKYFQLLPRGLEGGVGWGGLGGHKWR